MASPSPSSSTAVPAIFRPTKLRLDSSVEEYMVWRELMLRLLESRFLVGFVDGDQPPPSESNSQMAKEWKRLDRVVKEWLLEALSDQLLPTFIGCKTSRDAWTDLEIMFCQPTATHPFAHQGEEAEYKALPLPLYNAALRGDWAATEEILIQYPDAAEARAAPNLDTVLHIAVGTGRSIPYLQALVDYMTDEELGLKDSHGYTALYVAARMGNLAAATVLVNRCPPLLYLPDKWGVFPVHKAAMSGHRPTLEFFISQTRDDLEDNPYAGDNGVLLLYSLIDSDFFDIAMDLIEKYPDLARRKHPSERSAMRSIALKNAAFPSGARFSFWERLLYSVIKMDMESEPQPSSPKTTDIENPSCCALIPKEFGSWQRVIRNLHTTLYRVIIQFVPRAKWILDQKIKHEQALKLVTRLCECLDLWSGDGASNIYSPAMFKAAELGIHEVIEAIVEKFPVAVYSAEASTHRYIFHIAVENRSEKVFNLMYQMSEHRQQFSSIKDLSGNTMLHMVASLAPPHKLNLVSGAALQMQRELQWFKEVEKFVEPHDREQPNYDGQTARMIFTEEHSSLKIQGEKWMKDTANSCSIAAALIATVVFAAAITVPGGNADSGYPLFVESGAFIIFAVSDAISLFTSSTSLLMFLSILTSRYAEEDFLYALPKRLCVGLFTLFLSILFMMVAFSATIFLVFGKKSAWVLIPVAVLACMPVTSFVLLQFPLLVDVISSTYGRGIFGKQSDRPFH